MRRNYSNVPQRNINVEEREEFINYVIENGKYKPSFYPASNLNPDYLTGKIGQEYKGVRTPQAYFLRRYHGIPQPIDNYYIEHRNNFNDYYTLGKDYNPFDECQNQFRVPYLNRQNNFKKEYNNYYRDSNLPINDLRYNYSKDNYKEIHSVSKSMNSFDLEEYKRRINEREKLLISNYETYNKIQNVPNIAQIKTNDNSNIKFTEINHSTNNPNKSNIQFTEIKSLNNNTRNNSNKVTQGNYNRTVVSNPNNLTISTYNSRKTPKYKITNYYTDYNNHQQFPKDINEHVEMPSKIYFI